MPHLLLALEDARVTPYIAQFGGISYQIASISGIRAAAGKKLSLLVLLGGRAVRYCSSDLWP